MPLRGGRARRVLLVSFLAIAVLALGTVALVHHFSASTTCTKRVLDIVAHHDDDLLFLSPDSIKDLQAGACVRTLFLVASDYHADDREGYLKGREAGIRSAYAL